MVQVHAGSVTNVTEPTNPSTRLDGTMSDVDSAAAAVLCCSFSSFHYRNSLHACITFSATSTLPHRYIPTVLAYSARLQDCSTSHPTSANHLRGHANPYLSRENDPSRLIKEMSNPRYPSSHHPHARATLRACPQVLLGRSRQLLHESS